MVSTYNSTQNSPIARYSQDRLYEALAILGQADRELLEHFLNQKLDTDALSTQEPENHIFVLQASTLHPTYSLEDSLARELLEELERTARQRYTELHERGLGLLCRRLRAGDSHFESSLNSLFLRLAQLYYLYAPQRLLDLTQQLQDLPVTQPGTRHNILYFAALSLRKGGEHQAAIEAFDALLSKTELDDTIRAKSLNMQAICHLLVGHYAEASDKHTQSLALWQRLGDEHQQGTVLKNLGIVAYELQMLDEAERYFKQSLAICTRIGSLPGQAIAHLELGLIHRDRGDWDKALAGFTFFVDYWRSQKAWNRVGNGLTNVGEVRFFLGQFDEAEEAFHQTLQYMTTSAYRVDVLLNLGMIHLVRDAFDKAVDYFTQAHTLATEIDRRNFLPNTHYRLGYILAQLGDTSAAHTHFEASIDLIEDLRHPLQDEGMKIGLLGRWQQIYESMILLCLEQSIPETALYFVERARSRAFLDMVSSSHKLSSSKSPSHTPSQLSSLALEEPVSAREIQLHLPEDMAVIEFFVTGLPGTHTSIISNLPNESHFLRRYLLPPERLLAFVITQEFVQVFELESNVQQIQSQLFNRTDGRLRGITPKPGQRLKPMRRWQNLGDKLIRPLHQAIANKRHLTFVPHGLLHYLPLHALIDLSELTGTSQATTSYAPSASVLLKTATLEIAPAGGADFKRASLPHKSEHRPRILSIGVNEDGLAHAEAEAAWITQLFGGDTFLGQEATRTTVCQALSGYDVIHFSCHGHFQQLNPMASSLQLADGELTAGVLLETVTLQADLVILSACDTGLNELHPGDELMGLTRAFIGSGARSLLATLWPVNEIPTRLFMETFYESWLTGSTKAEAVRIAQQTVAGMSSKTVHSRLEAYGMMANEITDALALFQAMLPGAKPFDHPFYWGGFVLIGSPD
ncbi:MAG: CHAT domain-containing tetratricopeptide repeat protein [Chloroflexota bacterium]